MPKQIFSLRIGEPLPIQTICHVFPDIPQREILRAVELPINEHYVRFGQEPYSVQYSRRLKGYSIIAGPMIGLINCGDFNLKIQPKFQGLEIGKCLQLAHKCKFNPLVAYNNTVVDEELSDQVSLSGIDYFAQAYISSVIDVIDAGLLYTRSSTEGPDEKFSGTLIVERHISTASLNIAPYTKRQIRIPDTPANQTLKAALETCRINSSDGKIKGLATRCLAEFLDVSDKSFDEEYIYEYETTYARSEYDKALNLARIILEGFDPRLGNDKSFTPYFTINLDKLFERFISYELRQKLKKEKYKLNIQDNYSHPIIPIPKDKFFSPDIVVSAINENSSSVVIDTKNKYSLLEESGTQILTNADLFQISYYCLAMKTNIAMLIYPGNKSNSIRYPFRGSEGESSYETKRVRLVNQLKENPLTYLKINVQTPPIGLYLLRVNLEGTMQDTLSSIAELALFIADSIKGKI